MEIAGEVEYICIRVADCQPGSVPKKGQFNQLPKKQMELFMELIARDTRKRSKANGHEVRRV